MTPPKTPEDIRAKVSDLWNDIAPEIDFQSLNPAVRLRDQVEIDSVDFARFVTRLYEELGVNVPETDYAKLDTLDHIVDYLAREEWASVSKTRD